MNETNATTVGTVGWRAPPDGRGTFDILKSCGGTIILLCWSSVCPNIPSIRATFWQKWRMKTHLFCLAILGPEFVFAVALGQLNAAWNAKKKFHDKNHKSWDMRQCFLVNMGGVHVKFTDRIRPFPVDCGQLLYLFENRYIDHLPDITKGEIDDRNKTDEFTRAIAIIQTLWFTFTSFARVAHGLHLTTLELTTLAFIFLMLASSICWWRKPMDISRPVLVIECHTAVQAILDRHQGSECYPPVPTPNVGRTPLSFLTRQEWFMSQFWAYYTQILRNIKSPRKQPGPPGSAECFSAIDFQAIDFKWELYFGHLAILYTCIFLAAWNLHFPTDIERELWRASCVISSAYGAIGCLVAWLWQWRERLSAQWSSLVVRKKNKHSSDATEDVEDENGEAQVLPEHNKVKNNKRTKKRFGWIRNLSPWNDPQYEVPMRLSLLTTALCIVYCFSRAYILIEDLVSLRSLLASAYQTVNWSQYSPLL